METRPTSIETYAELLQGDYLSTQQKNVVGALRDFGPMTGSEINGVLKSTSAHKRLSELATLGVAQEMIPRYCRATGRRAIEWRLRKLDEPMGSVKKEKRVTRAELEAEIETLQKKVGDLEHQLEVARWM